MNLEAEGEEGTTTSNAKIRLYYYYYVGSLDKTINQKSKKDIAESVIYELRVSFSAKFFLELDHTVVATVLSACLWDRRSREGRCQKAQTISSSR